MNFVTDEKYIIPSKNRTEFFNNLGEICLNEAEALVKVVRNEIGKTNNFIRENAFGVNRGSLVDPSEIAISNYTKKINDVPEFPFKRVSDKAIAYYVEFLKKRQPSFLRMAEREKDI